MIFLWFLIFLSWPIAEIALFVEAGQTIGWAATILLTIATSIAGTFLMRLQGYRAMSRFFESADKGELPVDAVLDGMGIFTAGLLLLLPGFLSDAIGLLLFIPPLRRRLVARMLGQFTGGGMRRRPQSGPPPRPRTAGFRRSGDAIDAEFETIEPKRPPGEAPQSSASPADGASGTNGNSPWRRS